MSDRNGDDFLINQNEELGIRLTLAQAWLSLWQKAYDALLYHGINFRETPEYKDGSGLLDKALAAPDLNTGRVSVMEYLKRLESGIVAAIRRKGLRRIDNPLMKD